ncbi:hypothetical protein [Actinoplanes sp. NPDC051494]|uniref:hypothetical protein n=1 Tax=Actinoplanes sp. NPDC051494 TaxID=3363907 RepID=UPI0037B6DFA8
MSPAALLVRLAARRWPADLAPDLEREWLAELDSLRGGPLRQLAFAGSLAVSPTVDGPTWPDRARTAAAPVVLTLLAAALFNGVRLAGHQVGPVAAAAALVVAVVAMARPGRRTTPGGVVMIGACVYAFLLAGNPVAVMPFMGWRDIGPALAVWTLGTALVARSRSRLVAVTGTLLTLDLAVAAGSLHAAATLGADVVEAPLWLPRALLPGTDPPVLISNAAAMAGVLTLASVSVLAGLLRRGPARRLPIGRIPAGVTTALAGVAVGEALRRAPRAVDAGFGFGFLTHPAGLAATVLVIALAVAYRSPLRR